MSQLQSDLRIVFGFSRKNADKAEQLFNDNKLDQLFYDAIKGVRNKPYKKMNTSRDTTYGPFSILTRLNYLLSTGQISDT